MAATDTLLYYNAVGRPIPRHPDDLAPLAAALSLDCPPPKPPPLRPHDQAPESSTSLPSDTNQDHLRRLRLSTVVLGRSFAQQAAVVGDSLSPPPRNDAAPSVATGSSPAPPSSTTRRWSNMDPHERSRELRRRVQLSRQGGSGNSSTESARTSRAPHLHPVSTSPTTSPGRSSIATNNSYREASVQAIIDAGRRYNALLERDRTGANEEGRAGAGLADALRRHIDRNSNGTWTFRGEERRTLVSRVERLRAEMERVEGATGVSDPSLIDETDDDHDPSTFTSVPTGDVLTRRGGLLDAVQRLGHSVEALSRTSRTYRGAATPTSADSPPSPSQGTSRDDESPAIIAEPEATLEAIIRRRDSPLQAASPQARNDNTEATLRTARNALRSAVGFAERLEVATRRLSRISASIDATETATESSDLTSTLQRSIAQLRSVSSRIDQTLGEDFESALSDGATPTREHPVIRISSLTGTSEDRLPPPPEAPGTTSPPPLQPLQPQSSAGDLISRGIPRTRTSLIPPAAPRPSTLTLPSPSPNPNPTISATSSRLRNPFLSPTAAPFRPEEEESSSRRRRGFLVDRNGDVVDCDGKDGGGGPVRREIAGR